MPRPQAYLRQFRTGSLHYRWRIIVLCSNLSYMWVTQEKAIYNWSFWGKFKRIKLMQVGKSGRTESRPRMVAANVYSHLNRVCIHSGERKWPRPSMLERLIESPRFELSETEKATLRMIYEYFVPHSPPPMYNKCSLTIISLCSNLDCKNLLLAIHD